MGKAQKGARGHSVLAVIMNSCHDVTATGAGMIWRQYILCLGPELCCAMHSCVGGPTCVYTLSLSSLLSFYHSGSYIPDLWQGAGLGA